MSGNRVTPSPDGSIEIHHLQRLGEGETNHVDQQNHDDGINFGGKPEEGSVAESKIDDQKRPTTHTEDYVDDWEELSNTDKHTGDINLPGSPDYGERLTSPYRGIESRSPNKGDDSSSQDRRNNSVSPSQAENPWSPVPSASPDHKLPLTPDIEEDSTQREFRDIYTPAVPHINPEQEPDPARYDSPTASCRSSRSGSLAELLPSQRMVPLAPIGSNRITPIDKSELGSHHRTHVSNKAPLPAISQGGAGVQPVIEQATPAYQVGAAVNNQSELTRRYSSRELLHENIRPWTYLDDSAADDILKIL